MGAIAAGSTGRWLGALSIMPEGPGYAEEIGRRWNRNAEAIRGFPVDEPDRGHEAVRKADSPDELRASGIGSAFGAGALATKGEGRTE